MDNKNIETITNSLAEGYKQLVLGTFQEASQVQIQRRANRDLRNKWIYIANLPLFRMNGGDLEYGLGGRQVFDAVAGEDIDQFTSQILKNGIYSLTESQKEKLESLAEDIVWAKAAELNLKKENSEWNYFSIDTTDFAADKLAKGQKSLAAKVHGDMEAKSFPKQELSDYGETMNMLNKEGRIQQTRIWLATPVHIKSYLADNAVVARAAWLCGFDSSSSFLADIRSVDDQFGLRGVRRASISEPAVPAIPAGDALKNAGSPSAAPEITLVDCYQRILVNPAQAVQALDDERAAGLSRIVADYLATRGQQSS